jgi:predicted enzyme related to lactoylglutathione lyase
MNELNDPGEPRILDLSSLTFDEFAAFFFARHVVPDDKQYDYFLTDLHGEKYFESVPSSPEVLVNHLTKMFAQFGQIVADIQAEYARLKKLGVTFTKEPTKSRGSTFAVLDDTCGNLMQIVQLG